MSVFIDSYMYSKYKKKLVQVIKNIIRGAKMDRRQVTNYINVKYGNMLKIL